MESRFPGGVDEAVQYEGVKVRVLESDNTRSHTGNAARLARLYGDELRYALGLDWLKWDERRWSADTLGGAFRRAQDVAHRIHAESAAAYTLLANLEPGDGEYKQVLAMAKRIWSWARDSEQVGHIRGTLEAASNHKRFRVAPEDLDAHPDLLNCQNGTLDLHTFKLRPHRPEDLLTKITAAGYEPAARAPSWEANLERFIPDADVRSYLQRCAGQSLLGRRSEELLYLYGAGANFKSTFLRALREAAGDYADITNPDVLISSRGRKSVSDKSTLAELRGLRLVTTSEIEQNQSLAEGMVKELTETHIRAEHKHRDPFTFRNQMTFMFSANHKLEVTGTDEGIWRRLRLIEWGVELPADERDPLYFEKHLQQELDGILAWAVRGLQDYRDRGDKTDPPAQVLAWTQRYREQSDLFARWLAEECELVPDECADANQLWESFASFMRGERALARVSRMEWKDQLADAGIREERPRQADGTRPRIYVGVRVLTPSI